MNFFISDHLHCVNLEAFHCLFFPMTKQVPLLQYIYNVLEQQPYSKVKDTKETQIYNILITEFGQLCLRLWLQNDCSIFLL